MANLPQTRLQASTDDFLQGVVVSAPIRIVDSTLDTEGPGIVALRDIAANTEIFHVDGPLVTFM
jgi:hypothetical protein